MKKYVSLLLGIVCFTAIFTLAQSAGSGDELTYLPLVLKSVRNETATPTATAVPTATPTNIPAPPVTSGDVRITHIFYDGIKGSQEPDEYVEIHNFDTTPVQLDGWTLRDDSSRPKTFTFPNYMLQPGQTCRVYTNEIHPEWCGFSFGNGAAIWNNDERDCGHLRNQAGVEMDKYCYTP